MVRRMRIAVLGPEGTFSDRAYMEYAKAYFTDNESMEEKLEPLYCQTIDDVFAAVCPDGVSDIGDVCEFGIVPIENTLDGYVQRTLDLLLEKDVYIIGENFVPVQFSMVGNTACLADVRKLYVQFKANGQCRRFINSLSGVKIVPTESNMESYYRLKDAEGAAAIVPKHIADNEKDRFVIENVTDADKNYTRFVIFKRGVLGLDEPIKMCYADDKSKKVRVPVYIMPATDRPGILFEILKGFHEKQINLISIMSRPTKQEIGTYNFYIEIDGFCDSIDVILDTLRQIKVYNDIKILGVYYE